jgi:hypothetical protein
VLLPSSRRRGAMRDLDGKLCHPGMIECKRKDFSWKHWSYRVARAPKEPKELSPGCNPGIEKMVTHSVRAQESAQSAISDRSRAPLQGELFLVHCSGV